MNKKYCPFIHKPCMKTGCSLWIPDGQRVISKKTHKPEIKDTSGCALMKIGEYSTMRMWNESTQITVESTKLDAYEHCSRNPIDNCPHVGDGVPCSECKWFKE